jgi:hypothetical protein
MALDGKHNRKILGTTILTSALARRPMLSWISCRMRPAYILQIVRKSLAERASLLTR